MKTASNSNSEPWIPCPPGTLQQLQERIHIERRRKKTHQIGAPALFLGMILLGSGFLHWSELPTKSTPGGLACHEVQAQLPRYLKRELPPELHQAIKKHLDNCPHCHDQLRTMQKDSVSVQADIPFLRFATRSILAILH